MKPPELAIELSRRETQVAGLVAEGLSNRKIGVALHPSERTVETHVQHILNKLAFHSRSHISLPEPHRGLGRGANGGIRLIR